MQKFYSLLVGVIVSMFAFQAKAVDDVCLTAYCDFPSDVTVTTYSNPGGSSNVTFIGGEAYIEFLQTKLRYFYVTAKSFPITCTLYDADDEVISVKEINRVNSMSAISVPVTADGGRFVIEKQPEIEMSKLTVQLDGSSAYVRMTLGQRAISLKKGQQVIEFNPKTESSMYIVPSGITSLYQVLLDGAPVKMTQNSAEGSSGYQYSATVADGQTLTIVVNYPDVKYPVSVEVEGAAFDEFIKSVKINGKDVAMDDLSALDEVQAGSVVSVVGDGYNYKVLECWKNGEQSSINASSNSELVVGPTSFKFVVEKIDRPYEYIIYTNGNADVSFYSPSYKSSFSLPNTAGYIFAHFGVGENPFTLQTLGMGVPEENMTIFLYVNDALWTSDLAANNPVVNINPNDVIKVFGATSAPSKYSLSFTLEGLDDIKVVADYVTPINFSARRNLLEGTHIAISNGSGNKITGVKVNGTEVNVDENGEYCFTLKSDSEVEVTSDTSGVENVEVAPLASRCVYNIQGVLLNDTGMTDTLPSGVYIVGGKKVYVRH